MPPRGSVRARGAPAAGPPLGSRGRVPHPLQAGRPAAGHRLNDSGKVTCDPLQQTAGALFVSGDHSSPMPPRLLSGVVRHPSRSEALDPTVIELLPNDT